MKRTYDRSIFAWRDLYVPHKWLHSLLADHPSQFIHSGNVAINVAASRLKKEEQAFTIRNTGIEIPARLLRLQNRLYIMPIFCVLDDRWVCVVLSRYEDEFACVNSGQFALIHDLPPIYQTILIVNTFSSQRNQTREGDDFLPQFPRQTPYSLTGSDSTNIPCPILLSSSLDHDNWSVIG